MHDLDKHKLKTFFVGWKRHIPRLWWPQDVTWKSCHREALSACGLPGTLKKCYSVELNVDGNHVQGCYHACSKAEQRDTTNLSSFLIPQLVLSRITRLLLGNSQRKKCGKEITGLEAVTHGSLLTHSFWSSFFFFYMFKKNGIWGPGDAAFEICSVTSRMAGTPSHCVGSVKKTLMTDSGRNWAPRTLENCNMKAMTFRNNYF